MFQGQSIFSGLNVPRGSGMHCVQNDGKVVFTANRRERNFLQAKVSARSVKWTESSRSFFKKNNKTTKEESQVYTITKKVRGFNVLPKAAVEKNVKEIKPKQNAVQSNEKVHKNINTRR